MSKNKLLDLPGLAIFKELLTNLISNHVNNTNVHISEQERYKINNFPNKLSSFENDMDYITMSDFLLNSDYDGGDAIADGALDEKELDGGNASNSAE